VRARVRAAGPAGMPWLPMAIEYTRKQSNLYSKPQCHVQALSLGMKGKLDVYGRASSCIYRESWLHYVLAFVAASIV
jgi:hypothetical protein